jgi:NAD-dependent SIR2 family protein deacetylase
LMMNKRLKVNDDRAKEEEEDKEDDDTKEEEDDDDNKEIEEDTKEIQDTSADNNGHCADNNDHDAGYNHHDDHIKEIDLVLESEEERQMILDYAKARGFWKFLDRFRSYTIKSLFQVFKADVQVTALDQDVILPLLMRAYSEACIRKRLVQYNTIDDAVNLIATAKNIMIITGAGVSVSCGIPDFRSKNGIYSRLGEFQLSDPQEMFDIHYFRAKPETFYSFAHEIYPSNFEPSISHYFIKHVEDRHKLLRNYSQNIDTLEQKAGIKNVLQCHGSFATASCIDCKVKVPGSDLEPSIFAKTVAMCQKCPDGIMKPDIVFFGEPLPPHVDTCYSADRKRIDLLIVMGSSLRVAPIGTINSNLPHNIPQILINREVLPGMNTFDIYLLGNSDVITQELMRRLGWMENPPAAFVQGANEYQWLFEGAIDEPEVPSDQSSEMSDETPMTPDTIDHDSDAHDIESQLISPNQQDDCEHGIGQDLL